MIKHKEIRIVEEDLVIRRYDRRCSSRKNYGNGIKIFNFLLPYRFVIMVNMRLKLKGNEQLLRGLDR